MILIALASAGRVADTGPLTTTALILIAAFAVLVIFGILWGARQKRIRVAAEEEEKRRAEALEATAPTSEPVAPSAPSPPEPTVIAAPKPKPAPEVAPEPVAEPAPVAVKPAAPKPAAPKPAAPAPAPATLSLTDVKGLGPKAVPLLAAQGIADLAALGGLDPARAAEVDSQLDALSGRLTRDRWVEQARLLAAGEIAEFEKTYGKL